jgi:hypothetical protein
VIQCGGGRVFVVVHSRLLIFPFLFPFPILSEQHHLKGTGERKDGGKGKEKCSPWRNAAMVGDLQKHKQIILKRF